MGEPPPLEFSHMIPQRFMRLIPAGDFFFRKRSKKRALVLGLAGPGPSNRSRLPRQRRMLCQRGFHALPCGKRGMRLRAPREPLGRRPLPCACAHFGVQTKFLNIRRLPI